MNRVRQNLKWWFLAGLFLATVLVWTMVVADSRSDKLIVAFLNIGQGDAIFIEAPNGNQVLIDAGPNKKVLRELGRVLPFYDRSIDLVIASHPDQDHIGGLPFVFDRFKIGHYLDSGKKSETLVFEALIKKISQENLEPIIARRGMRVILAQDIYLDILFPDRDIAGLDPNDASIITKLIYGETDFLFTGDSPKKIEEYLVYLDKSKLSAEVLKVGHHGSKTSTSISFLNEVRPQIAIIQAGENNRYGHPHQEVTGLLASVGAQILSNAIEGTIILESNGREIHRR